MIITGTHCTSTHCLVFLLFIVYLYCQKPGSDYSGSLKNYGEYIYIYIYIYFSQFREKLLETKEEKQIHNSAVFWQ